MKKISQDIVIGTHIGQTRMNVSLLFHTKRAQRILGEYLEVPPVKTAIKKAEDQPIGKQKDFHITVLTHGRYMITSESLRILESEGYFTDKIVNSFIWCYSKKMKMSQDVIVHPSTVMFGLFAAAMVNGRNDDRLDLRSMFVAIRTMTDRKCSGIYVFPRCAGKHWWRMIVDIDKKIVYSLDSKVAVHKCSTVDVKHEQEYRLLLSLFKLCLMKERSLQNATGKSQKECYDDEKWRNKIPNMEGFIH